MSWVTTLDSETQQRASLKAYVQESLAVKNSLLDQLEGLQKAANLLLSCFQRGGKVIAIGNGGSASDVQHFVAELTGRFKGERRSLPALALTSNTSSLTAIGNDYGFENIFSRQLEGLLASEDILFAISTSGRSANVLKAVQLAKQKGVPSIGLTGSPGEPLVAEVTLPIAISSSETSHVQEVHITVIHAICMLLDQAYLSDES